jgi:hypothetical protein
VKSEEEEVYYIAGKDAGERYGPPPADAEDAQEALYLVVTDVLHVLGIRDPLAFVDGQLGDGEDLPDVALAWAMGYAAGAIPFEEEWAPKDVKEDPA